MNTGYQYLRVLVFPEIRTVQQAVQLLIRGMIGCLQDHVESGIRNRIPNFGRRIKIGKTGKSPGIAAHDSFLIDDPDVCRV